MTLPVQSFSVRYVLVFGATAATMFVANIATTLLSDVDISGVTSLAATIVPAFDAGANFRRRMRRPPASDEAWRLSGVFILLNVCIALILLGLLGGAAVFAELPLWATIAGLSMAAGIGLALTRAFFGLGARTEDMRLVRD